MPLSYRATPAVTASSSGVTSWSVTKQAGTAAGDWIFIYLFGCDYSTTVACSGFTAKEDPNSFGVLLYRLADGTEGSSFTITGLGGSVVTSVIATVAGAAATLDPATVSTPVSGGPSTSIPVSGVTLANSGDWLLWFGGNQNSFTGPGQAITPPSGFTSRATNGAASANATVMLADNQSASAGATGTKTGTVGTATYYSGVMIGLTPAATGLTVTTTSLPAATVGTAYSATLTASGGTGNYTWSLASGTLPAGLSLSSAGVISGTPTASGTSNFTVQVVDV